jgi:glycosyltransferase involved in cell wall biosynthesis
MDYVIITPAYNEEKHIGQTIDSVLSQQILPKVWVIVDDGSTDGTADVIKRKAEQHTWIRYVFRPKTDGQTYFASSVYAILAGLEEISVIPFDYIAILDADISLFDSYYETIFQLFSQDPKLGIASGNSADRVGERIKKHLYDRRSCGKAIMVFRRQCYDDIGGLMPMKYGGEDTCACFMARMKGWKTWAFHELLVMHNKPLGTGASRNLLKIRFRQGISEYFLATHPLFLIAKSLRRCIKESPILIGGLARMAGFVYAHFMGEERQISDELIKYIRSEQRNRVIKGNSIPVEFQIDTSL